MRYIIFRYFSLLFFSKKPHPTSILCRELPKPPNTYTLHITVGRFKTFKPLVSINLIVNHSLKEQLLMLMISNSVIDYYIIIPSALGMDAVVSERAMSNN